MSRPTGPTRVFGDADAPIVVELAQKPDLQGVPGGRARDADRGAAAVPRRLGAAGTGDRGRNKAEAYNGFSAWTLVRQPGRDRRERPGQGKSVKWNSLLCNLIVFHTAIDMMEVIRQLVAEGWQVTAQCLAQLSPYLTSHILRFGAYATDELHIPPPGPGPPYEQRHRGDQRGGGDRRPEGGAAGVSSTHLAQRFKELIGVTPKRLARTYRFAATVFAINPAGPIDWGDLAGGAGYFDQAHFGHEFRAFTGLTPTRYVEVRRRFLREHPGHALDGWPLPAD